MRKFSLSLLLILLSFYAVAAQCTSAYSAASYALAHTKKALKADNFDHQMLYADRGVEAMEKAQVLIEDCGCQGALNQIIEAHDNLLKAVEPDDWKAGRFFTQIALDHIKNVMGELDRCTTGTAPAEETKDLTASVDTNTEYLASNNDLSAQQANLEAEKRKLEEAQRKLEEKIARQQALAEEAQLARERELEEQLVVKRAAETHLEALEQNLRDLSESLDCPNAMALLNGSYQRDDSVLQNENLKETKRYYLQYTIRMQKDVAAALERCKNQ